MQATPLAAVLCAGQCIRTQLPPRASAKHCVEVSEDPVRSVLVQ